LHIERSTRGYTSATLTGLSSDMLEHPGPEVTFPATEAPNIGPIATATGMATCLRTLGEDDADNVYVDVATYEGQPAAVIVAVSGRLKEIYVVERSCTQGDPHILTGPVPLP
jgi:hypothetical protein